MNLINENIHKIKDLCKKYKVKNLYVFGSILTPRFNEKSDVDLLFNFEPEIDYNTYADYYFDLRDSLVSLLGRAIDLVDEKTLRNPYFIKSVESSKQLIYGGE